MTSAPSNEPWNVLKLLRWTQDFFQHRGIDEPRLDAEILLGHTLGLSRVQLYTHFDRPLGPEDLASFKSLIKRRTNREPVAYIVGHREFWSMPFMVDKRVLIPRPDTETVVELARYRARMIVGEPIRGQGEISSIPLEDLQTSQDLADHALHPEDEDSEVAEAVADKTRVEPVVEPWRSDRRLLIADIGTGSGIIAVALARELPYADIVATDISEDALNVARINAETHKVTDRITFLKGDLTEPLSAHYEGRPFDLIVSNPPYIPESDLAGLDQEVQGHEPRGALTSGPSGLEAIEGLVSEAWRYIRPGGYLICEIGHDQGESAPALFRAHSTHWDAVRVIRDRFSGQHRVLEARRIQPPLS